MGYVLKFKKGTIYEGGTKSRGGHVRTYGNRVETFKTKKDAEAELNRFAKHLGRVFEKSPSHFKKSMVIKKTK